LTEKDQPESVHNCICDVLYRLQRANEFAQENLKIAQTGMKTWYNRKTRKRSFQPGDCVLALLPIHGSPLEARYCRPYTVQEKTSDVGEKPTALTTVIHQQQVVPMERINV